MRKRGGMERKKSSLTLWKISNQIGGVREIGRRGERGLGGRGIRVYNPYRVR